MDSPQDPNILPDVPPEIKYAQPGALDHEAHKSWFSMHHILAYTLLGMLGLVVVVAVLYFKVSVLVPEYLPPVHHEKTTTLPDNFIVPTLPEEISDNESFKTWLAEKVKAYNVDPSSFSEAKIVTLNIERVVAATNSFCEEGKSISSPTKIRTACIYSGEEPDSYLYIQNNKTNKVSTVTTCGTICTYENGFWLDDSNFVFLETNLDMDYEDDKFNIYTFNVFQYDFINFKTTNWSSTLRVER
jgi:hypothetical protein